LFKTGNQKKPQAKIFIFACGFLLRDCLSSLDTTPRGFVFYQYENPLILVWHQFCKTNGFLLFITRTKFLSKGEVCNEIKSKKIKRTGHSNHRRDERYRFDDGADGG